MKITILGCGTSSGVPAVGLGWGDCDPNHPKNRRMRSSVYIETDCGYRLLIDTTPDCRTQLLNHNINALDAILYSHAHADHCHGIDEMRWICFAMKQALPIYSSSETLEQLQTKFDYCFTPLAEGANGHYYKPVLIPHSVEGNFTISKGEQGLPLEILAFEQDHGFSKTLGFRIGNFAYSTDVVSLSDQALNSLQGLDLWVVDALQHNPHPTHAHLARTLEWVEQVKPKQTYLTHMNTRMDYASLLAMLPEGVLPAYDGLTLEI